MVPSACPKSLLVIGSVAIGIEFASFYRALGAEVTVIEALPRILPVEDEEVSAAAQKAFERRKMAFRVGAKVTRLAKTAKGVALELEAGEGKTERLEAERAIVAVGIAANVEDMGLEALGLKLDRGHVAVGDHGATNVKGLYAIGDVAGAPWLAHKAMHEGVHCVEAIAGFASPKLAAPIPGCTYSTPQIASVGLTEAQAKAAGREVKVGRFPFRANGKAIAAGETEGFVKTVFDASTGALIGAHMIGGEVTEMIQGFVIAMTLEATEAELQATVFPHPTMSEAMHEASLDAYGMVLHI
jgi:dihydrolipoamide dehydrogenase